MGERLSFGVDWYPEQWDESTWERDCERMRAQGVSVVRMMEFAWTIVEPEKGRYDFSLFERAIEVAASRGLKVILGTPTATFPAWLLDEGEVLMTSPEGRVRDFGARRMGCYNAPAYREAARKVAAEAAKRLGGHPAVEGWQVDNELGHEGSDRCVCGHCRAAWHAWLERRYGKVEALNAQWGNVFWGTTYGRFDQVPVPRRQVSVGFNPGLLLDYDRFMSDSAAAFVDAQVEALKAAVGPDRYVTTNLYPPPLSNAIDMERLTRDMDFASWDNYPIWGAQDEPFPHHFQAFAQSYVRGLRGSGPFTVMEEFSGIQGHVQVENLGVRVADDAFPAAVFTGQDAHPGALPGRIRNRPGAKFLVGRIGHLFGGGQVDPELEAAHAALALPGHLGMDNAAGGLHPLGAAGAQIAPVAHAVPVLHVAVQHVGEGDEAAMGMVREAGDVFLRVVAAEVVQHQEGVQVLQGRGADAAVDDDAGAFRDGVSRHQLTDVAYGHDGLLLPVLTGIQISQVPVREFPIRPRQASARWN